MSSSHSAPGGKKRGMDTFDISGPLYLTSVDWKNAHHRRAVAASLVQAAYVLERDRLKRLKNGLKADALAPRWWEFFHFQLRRQLVDDNSSIFGAIFEFKRAFSGYNNMQDAPQYVIAFRGTVIKRHCLGRDLKLDLGIIKNRLHCSIRFEIAKQEVRSFVEARKDSSIWIAGHSLGSAIAMLAGKDMARTGIFLETFLFNSPFVGVPIGKIKGEKVRHKFRLLDTRIKAKFNWQMQRLDNPFIKLSGWLPSMFVHPDDHICSEYIGYFEHRKMMEDKGLADIERLAAQNSLASLFFKFFGNKTEPMHLLPSATLTVNNLTLQDAHAIKQWWRQDLQLQTKLYRY